MTPERDLEEVTDPGTAEAGARRSTEADGPGPTRGATPGTDEAKAFLRRVAVDDGRAIVERADAATGDLEAAAAFASEVGVDDLRRAIETVDDPALRARGERALAAFRRFRAAAVGDSQSDHFRCGHDTDLRDAGESPTE